MTLAEIRGLASDRVTAERILQSVFGLQHFYDEQWNAISMLLTGWRILMIEKTGFGKSLCYQFPAVLFDGVTIVFSPLIALMRDQVNALRQRGIAAQYINSEQTEEENATAIRDALDGKVKILYIAPERQENSVWLEAARCIRISMIVVDEAHTISVWGHDFRPSFRRIINLVRLQPESMPILATTATATKRVQNDIENQLGHGIMTIRGNLMRENFRLHVIETQSEEEKMVWLAAHLDELPGTGLIYTGIRSDSENYTRWLKYVGVDAVWYNAGLDAQTRKDIESGLMQNRWKCVVSTNALGMGIDKPDIRFIIHTQIPASPIHYYQEIGRAGRDGLPAYIVLFYNSKVCGDGLAQDYHLPKAFIDGAKPSVQVYSAVIDAVKNELLGERDIVKRTNIKLGQFRTIKADLIEQGIVREVMVGRKKCYEYQYNAPELNVCPFEELRKAKLSDLDAMIRYVYTREPRMKYLCDYLGDSYSGAYTGCDNTSKTKWTSSLTTEYEQRIKDFRESYFPEISCTMRGSNMIDGVAASFYGVTEVGMAIHRSKYCGGGDFPDFLLRLTLKAYRRTFGNKRIHYVMFVPPTSSGALVENFARKVANTLGVPFSKAIVKVKQTAEQKGFHNAYGKKDNVNAAFDLNGLNISGLTILLIDDIYDSGATLKEIGRMLTGYGATEIVPLVIAKTVGDDNI